MTVYSEKDPEVPEVQEKGENEAKNQNSVLQKFKRYSMRNKVMIVISFILHSIFILAVGAVIGYNIGTLEEKHSIHAYDILENDEHFELLSTFTNQTNQGKNSYFFCLDTLHTYIKNLIESMTAS